MNTTSNHLLNIAKAQKGILWCILANLIFFIVPFTFIITLPFQIYYIYKLVKELNLVSLNMGSPILWCICMFIPLLSLILLLVLSQKATKILKDAGVKVGLMGANLKLVREQSARF